VDLFFGVEKVQGHADASREINVSGDDPVLLPQP
jgi:hypothetical protein